jgi:hypothetical protein
MTEQTGLLVSCRGELWAVTAHEPSPRGFPGYVRISRIDEHGNATALVVGPSAVEVLGHPVFQAGDNVHFGLDSHGVVLADSGGDYVTVVSSDFRRSYTGGSKFKEAEREIPVARGLLVRDNIGLSQSRL